MSNELYHHGIKGMKWGVRRTPKQLGYAVAKKVPSGEKKAPKVAATKILEDNSSEKQYQNL